MQVPLFYYSKTPTVVKAIVWITSIISLASPILSFLFARYLYMSGPSLWFPLTLQGLEMGWLWQPFTYLFLQSPSTSLTLSLFFSLFFHMLLFWFAAKEIVFRFSSLTLLLLYLGGGFFSGLVTAAFLSFFSIESLLFGSGPALFALLIGWSSLQKEIPFSPLFFIHLGTRAIVLILLGLTLLIHLIHAEWGFVIATLAGAAYGALFSILFLQPKRKMKPKLREEEEDIEVEATIIGKEPGDEEFMDRMLDKIGKLGESSLTQEEKDRLDQISRKKRS